MIRTRVKICGITRPEDAIVAAKLGADAIGLVFFDKSPRVVNIEEARQIVEVLPPFITIVGLFVNPSPKEMAAVLHRVPLDLLQFHGDEEPGECDCFGKPFIKAIRMRNNVDLKAEVDRFKAARGILVDSYHPDMQGGTGLTFDWSRIPRNLNKHIILAGGLTPTNVWQVISAVRPYAVDVSSGVEVEKGIKEEALISAFIRSVNNV